jgi:endonuclease/exonuclease/phosphatase family metal-dependent hydrolase
MRRPASFSSRATLTGHGVPGGQSALAATATALAIVLLLQCERVFVPTMIFVVDQSNREELTANTAVVFLAMLLGAALVRLGGTRQAALASAGVLTVSRVVIQFIPGHPELRWQIGALGLIAAGWLLIALLSGNRDGIAVGIALGFWLDLCLRAGFDTIDLPYMASREKDAVSIILAALMTATVGAIDFPESAAEAGWLDTLPVVGIGAGIGAYALISGNLGLAAIRAGNDLQESLWLLSLGPVAAIALWLFPIKMDWAGRLPVPRHGALAALVIAAGAIGLVGVVEPVERSGLAATALALVSFASTYLTMLAARGRHAERRHPWVWRTGILFVAGMAVHAVTTLLYFSGTGAMRYAIVAFVALAVAGFVSAMQLERPLPLDYGRYLVPAGAVAGAFLIALLASRSDPAGGTAGLLDRQFTVVTYNIQNGFSRDNVWDLEATARTIEGLEPDIVLLQESGRGWFALGWADQVWWLSQRLDMEFAFGAASHDDLWGNAILSSASLIAPETLKYASSQNLHRSVVSARIPIDGGELWVASTHLDNPTGAGAIRLEQTEQLLQFWDGQQPAVIGGDFNAQPDSDVVATITGEGLVDTAAAAGDPQTTSESGNRIDYVFATPELQVASAEAPDVWTSDHRPLRVVLELGAVSSG